MSLKQFSQKADFIRRRIGNMRNRAFEADFQRRSLIKSSNTRKRRMEEINLQANNNENFEQERISLLQNLRRQQFENLRQEYTRQVKKQKITIQLINIYQSINEKLTLIKNQQTANHYLNQIAQIIRQAEESEKRRDQILNQLRQDLKKRIQTFQSIFLGKNVLLTAVTVSTTFNSDYQRATNQENVRQNNQEQQDSTFWKKNKKLVYGTGAVAIGGVVLMCLI